MLTLRYLLAVVAATAATAAVAASLLWTHVSDLPHVAKAIAAEAPHKSTSPISLQHHVVYYRKAGDKWLLVEEPGDTPPLYALALGCRDMPKSLLNKTYTKSNNTVAVGRCAYVMPWIEPQVDYIIVTHYYGTCGETDFFKPEVVEGVYAYRDRDFKIRLVVVC